MEISDGDCRYFSAETSLLNLVQSSITIELRIKKDNLESSSKLFKKTMAICMETSSFNIVSQFKTMNDYI